MRKSNKVEKTCLTCGKVFYVFPCRKDHAKYCGKKCQNESKKLIKGEDHPKCKECGLKLKSNGKRTAIRCRKCCDKNKIGENHPCWKGGPDKFKCKDCGIIIGWNKTRCTKCNNIYKRGKNTKPKIDSVCLQCNKKMKLLPCQNNRQFCSRQCYGKYQSIHKIGENNHNWRHGIRKGRKHITGYKQWRLSVFRRDKFLCQFPKCQDPNNYIEAHHIKRYADFPEERLNIDNGLTLCFRHHRSLKNIEEDYEKLFQSIVEYKKDINRNKLNE